MTQKIKVLDTSKHKDYDVSNLTNEELLEQIDVIAKEENVVNGMLKVIERSGYEIIYKEDTSSNVEFIVRNLLFSSNVYPIIANKKVALEGRRNRHFGQRESVLVKLITHCRNVDINLFK